MMEESSTQAVLVGTGIAERPTGKIPSTAVTNELARAINALGQNPDLSGEGRRFGIDAPFLGVVTDTGPEETEDDYVDERYWVRRSYIDGDDSETEETAETTTHVTTSYWNRPNTTTGESERFIVTATNLLEGSLDKEEAELEAYQSGTHLLTVGTRVIVFAMADAIGNVRYLLFPLAPLRTVAVLITGNAVGGGVYKAKMIAKPSADFDPSADAADDALGDLPDADDCFAVNMAESAQSTHDLTEGSPVSKVFVGVVRLRKSIKCDADGNADEVDGTRKHVVIFNGYDFSNCDEGAATTPDLTGF